MNRVAQNFWNAFLSTLAALAFMFSMSSLAGTSPNSAHQMLQAQSVVHFSMQAETSPKQDCDPMTLHDDCCEDSGDMPCSDSGGCKTVCSGFSFSSAVLGSVQDLRRFSKSFNLPFHQASYDETSPHLNAPPPRV